MIPSITYACPRCFEGVILRPNAIPKGVVKTRVTTRFTVSKEPRTDKLIPIILKRHPGCQNLAMLPVALASQPHRVAVDPAKKRILQIDRKLITDPVAVKLHERDLNVRPLNT